MAPAFLSIVDGSCPQGLFIVCLFQIFVCPFIKAKGFATGQLRERCTLSVLLFFLIFIAGCVITRSPIGEVKRRTLGIPKGEKRKRRRKRKRGEGENGEKKREKESGGKGLERYLLQTNMDHWLAQNGGFFYFFLF